MSINGGGRKGQVSLERVIVYSFIILSILIGAIILWRMGAFQQLIGRKGSVGFSQVVVGDWVVSASNRVYLELINEAESSVNIPIDGINMSTELTQCDTGPNNDMEIDSGARGVLTLNCPDLDMQYKIGDFYILDVDIDYTNLLTNRDHKSVGKLYGVVEAMDVSVSTVPITTQQWCSCGVVECDDPGNIDLDCTLPGCSYPGGTPEELQCDFCYLTRRDGDLFPNAWCWPKYFCGRECTSDLDCDIEGFTYPPNYPEMLKKTACPKCVGQDGGPVLPGETGTCQPDPDENPEVGEKCGEECNDPGTLAPECDEPTENECPYCKQFDYTSLSGITTTRMECDRRGRCGDECFEVDDIYQTYTTCVDPLDIKANNCPWCNMSAALLPGDAGYCEQGDCGKYCPDDSSCELGCRYCNLTVMQCELGDCAQPCTSHTQCEEGCECCSNGRCVACAIQVGIYVRNDTGGEMIAKITDDIHVSANATDSSGLEELWISDVMRITGVSTKEGAVSACYNQWADSISSVRVGEVYEGQVDDPSSALWSGGAVNWQDVAPWKKDNCGGTYCKNSLIESPLDENSYHCYAAIAREDTNLGRGIYSGIACDCIRVGFLDVTLIIPKPPLPP